MPILQIDVKDKRAIYNRRGGEIVCGNSDYKIRFTFDEEWDAYPIKTARFIAGGIPTDVIFEGDTVDAPIIRNAWSVSVGVHAGNLRTTTAALIPCQKSVLCENGEPADPPPNVYNQLMDQVTKGISSRALNIAYGDTEPEDTSKLWVKIAEPAAGVRVGKPVHDAELPEAYKNNKKQNDAQSVKIGSKIYVMGGGTDSIGSRAQVAICFDAETETYQYLPDGLVHHGSPGVCLVGSKIYLLGGSSYSALKDITTFDPETQAYTKLTATLGTGLNAMVCETDGRYVYLLGGNMGNASTSPQNAIYRFDTETEELTTLPVTTPTTASYRGSVVIGSKIYLFGGATSAYYETNRAYCFDMTTETLSTLATMPEAWHSMGCCEIDGTIYLVGGRKYSAANKMVYAYDVGANTYSTMGFTLPRSKSSMACESVGDRIYLLGGLIDRTSSNRGMSRLTIKPQLDEGFLQIHTEEGANVVKLIDVQTLAIEAPVYAVYKGDENGRGEEVEAAVYKNNQWQTI